MDKVDAKFLHHLLLPAMDLIQHLAGILFVKKFQGIQSLAELGKPCRNYGNALDHRRIGGKLADAFIQLFPVIDSLAENNLTVHGNPGLIKLICL